MEKTVRNADVSGPKCSKRRKQVPRQPNAFGHVRNGVNSGCMHAGEFGHVGVNSCRVRVGYYDVNIYATISNGRSFQVYFKREHIYICVCVCPMHAMDGSSEDEIVLPGKSVHAVNITNTRLNKYRFL